MQFNPKLIERSKHTKARMVSIRNHKYRLFQFSSTEVSIVNRCKVVIQGETGSGKTIALVVCLIEILSQLKKPIKGNKIYIECDTGHDVTFDYWLSECLFEMDFWKPKIPIEANIQSVRNELQKRGIYKFNSNSRFAQKLRKQSRPKDVELWLKVDDNPLSLGFGSGDLNLKTFHTFREQTLSNSFLYELTNRMSLSYYFRSHTMIQVSKVVKENENNPDVDKVSILGKVMKNRYGDTGEVFSIMEM